MAHPTPANLPGHLPGHIPSLDGLRAFSVLLVLIGHVAATHGAPVWLDKPAITSLGNIGVRFFFLISGFLITTLLLQETRTTGTINLKKFYSRRAIRHTPIGPGFSTVYGPAGSVDRSPAGGIASMAWTMCFT